MKPSWAASVPAASVDADRPPPATLVVAMALLVALAVGEAVHVAGRDELKTALRVALVLGIALQLPCAVFALRRSPVAPDVNLRRRFDDGPTDPPLRREKELWRGLG